MKSKCSDNVYFRSKELVEDRYDIMDRINKFYSRKKELQNDIERETENDPSEEVHEIWDKVEECDPLTGIKHLAVKADERYNNKNKPMCMYYSKGFCKKGSSCVYNHSNLDCKDHIDNGKCSKDNCPHRHREDCKFYKNRKGCSRNSSCAFLHRGRKDDKDTDNEDITNTVAEEEKIQELKNSITLMKSVISEKDVEIDGNRRDLKKLKAELEKKDLEIQEKDEIIKNLEHDEESTDGSDDDEDDEISFNRSEKNGKLIGNGHFGKHFEVRKGMEEEAESLRNEWRCKKK